MTYKTTARQMHFRAQEGSSSIRVTQRGYGGKGLPGDPITILPTLKEQFDAITARLKELPALIETAPSRDDAERLRREMAGKNSQYHNMRKIIYQGCMVGLERCFMSVAKARLPENLYLSLLDEARAYWTSQGYADLIPEPNRQERRRASRKLSYRNWRQER